MKKSHLLIAACTAIFSIGTIHAQDTTSNFKAKQQHSKQFGGKKNVYQDLNLTDAQKSQMKSIYKDASTKRESIVQNSSLTDEQKKKQLGELRNSTKKNIDGILTADQKAKLDKQVSERKQKGKKDMNAFAKELNLTQDQKDQIKAINQQNTEKVKGIKANQNLSADDKKQQMNELKKNWQTQFQNVLTADQKSKLQDLRKKDKGNLPQKSSSLPKDKDNANG